MSGCKRGVSCFTMGSLTQECSRHSGERLSREQWPLREKPFLLDDGFTNTGMATADWINRCLNCMGMPRCMHMRNRKVYQS